MFEKMFYQKMFCFHNNFIWRQCHGSSLKV